MENIAGATLCSKSARLVSVLFHPIFMPVYGLLVIFMAPTVFYFLPFDVKRLTVTVFVTTDILIPLALTPLLVNRGLISSWTMDSGADRVVALLFMTVLYSVTSYLIHSWHIPQFLKAYSYSLTIISLAMLVTGMWWKISLYAAGAGILTAAILTLSLRMATPLVIYITVSLLISGFVLSARLRLNRHNQSEVYAGYIAGLGGMMLLMALFQ
jgi:hypothetical protein